MLSEVYYCHKYLWIMVKPCYCHIALFAWLLTSFVTNLLLCGLGNRCPPFY